MSNVIKFEKKQSVAGIGEATTMTLKEITDLLEVRHDKAMVKIQELIVSDEFGTVSKTDIVYNSKGQTITTYRLDKRQSMAVAARLNVSLMMRIIDRWQELEEQVNKPVIDLNDPSFLRSALLTYTEKVMALEHKIEEDRPKVVFADGVLCSDTAITVEEYSKTLGIKGMGRNNMFKWLRDNKYLRSNNLPYQEYLDRGYFEVKEVPFRKGDGSYDISFQTLITPQGQVYFTNKLNKEGAK